MTFSLAFVDSVAASPTTRLDLMGSDWITLVDGTDFGMPPLKRAVAGTMMVDGEVIPASAYGNRVITLKLDASHLTPDAAATALQNLFRELDRPNNFLRYTPDTTQAITFLTFRTSADAVVWDTVNQSATVRIPAQPFGYGDKQTLSVATVVNDPADADGMHFDVSNLLGDVETPLFMSIPTNDVAQSPRRTSAIAVRRRGTVADVPFLLQAESMAMGTNTTVQANSASMSGAGSNFVRCTFGTPAMTSRLTVDHPATADVDARGTYRVYVRYRKSVSGDVIRVRLRCLDSSLDITGETYTLLASTQLHWQDLGLWQIPLGAAPVNDGFSGTPLPVGGLPLSFDAERVSGSGNLDIDAFIFVPADDKLGLVRWPDGGSETRFIIDPAATQVYGLGSSDQVTTGQLPEISGGLPYVSPGVTNRAYFVLDVGTDLAVDDITNEVDITPYYWPAYLYVRPATT